MRKIGIIAVSVLLTLCLVLPTTAANKKQWVIGGSMVSKDNLWWANAGKFMKLRTEQNGGKFVGLWAQGDQQKQLRDIEDLVQRGVDGIIMCPIQYEGSMSTIQTIHEAGIPVVLVGRISKNPHYTASVQFDDVAFGKEQGRFIADYFKKKGFTKENPACGFYIQAPIGGSYPKEEHDGCMSVIKDCPWIKAYDTALGPVDTMAVGLELSEPLLVRYDKLHWIAGNNDDLALGALRAAEAAGRAKDMIFVGSSSVPMGIQAIWEGRMHFTVGKSPALLMKGGVDTLFDILNGKKIEKVARKIAPIPITQDSVRTYRDPIFGGTYENPSTYKPLKSK